VAVEFVGIMPVLERDCDLVDKRLDNGRVADVRAPMQNDVDGAENPALPVEAHGVDAADVEGLLDGLHQYPGQVLNAAFELKQFLEAYSDRRSGASVNAVPTRSWSMTLMPATARTVNWSAVSSQELTMTQASPTTPDRRSATYW